MFEKRKSNFQIMSQKNATYSNNNNSKKKMRLCWIPDPGVLDLKLLSGSELGSGFLHFPTSIKWVPGTELLVKSKVFSRLLCSLLTVEPYLYEVINLKVFEKQCHLFVFVIKRAKFHTYRLQNFYLSYFSVVSLVFFFPSLPFVSASRLLPPLYRPKTYLLLVARLLGRIYKNA